jgi:hypothetical protein
MTAQTPAERQRTYTERREAQGLKLMRNLWAHPDDHHAVKALAEKLQRKRARSAQVLVNPNRQPRQDWA